MIKQYIIKDGNAYFIDGAKAKKVVFAPEGSMTITEEEIDIEGNRYTYDEIIKKLNIDFNAIEVVEEIKEPVVEEKIQEPTEEIKEIKNKKNR